MPAYAISSLCELVKIPAGTFLMGDTTGQGYPQERPVREVTVNAFKAAKYAVTAAEYFHFIEGTCRDFDELWCDFIDPCFILKRGSAYRIAEGCEHYPMIQVSWVGAIAYANWLSCEYGFERVYDLSTLQGDLSKNGFRLLTEAEWEYACGGTAFESVRFCWRDFSGPEKHLRASHARRGGFGLYEYSPIPVGSLPPNGFGLYEMLGNVNEWCHDRYGAYGTTDSGGPRHGSFRVIRGGCFLDGADKLRKSYRHGIHYQSKCMIDGFRLARNA